jgi:rhamnosyltransferase
MSKICAIIVTYNPQKGFFDKLAYTSSLVNKVLIADNSTQDDLQKKVLELKNKYKNIEVISNKDNLGIASALNQGVNYAIENNYDWVLTLDQDSFYESNPIPEMFKVYDEYSQKDKVFMLSSSFYNPGLKMMQTKIIPGKNYKELEVTMTSGNLVKVDIFKKLGLFDESLFIYHVDNDFCLKCSNSGYKILEVYKAILMHSEGNLKQYRLFGKTFTTTNHSPMARYYISRNLVILTKRYFFSNSMFITKLIIRYLILMAKVLCFENDKFLKLKLTFKGFIDGLLNKKGKLNYAI